MFNEFMQRHQSNAVLAALVGSLLALLGSAGSAGLTYYYSIQTQDRQIRLEQVSKFDASSADLVSAAGAFINAINGNGSKDLEAARRQINLAVATQINTSEDLKRAFGGKVAESAKEYEAALSDLNKTADKTSSATEMRAWSETFGRALDAKGSLSDEIYSSLGTRPRS